MNAAVRGHVALPRSLQARMYARSPLIGVVTASLTHGTLGWCVRR